MLGSNTHRADRPPRWPIKKTKESKTVGPARAPGALACPRSAHFSSNPPQVGRRLPAQGANKRRGIAVALVFLFFSAPLARVFCRALPKAEARFCRGESIDAALRAIFFRSGAFRTPPLCGFFVSALTNDFLGTSRKKRNDALRALNRSIGLALPFLRPCRCIFLAFAVAVAVGVADPPGWIGAGCSFAAWRR